MQLEIQRSHMRARTRAFPLLFCALLFSGTARDAIARHAKSVPRALYQEMQQVQLKAGEADGKMLEEMRSAHDALLQYCRRSPYWLHNRRGNADLLRYLRDKAHVNPYIEDEFLRKHLEADHKELAPKVEFTLLLDLGLSLPASKEWIKHPPESWQADPGTICILHNSEDLILLWPAGADGRPIKDSTTGDAQLILEQLR